MEFVRRNVNGNTGASSTSGSSGGIITSGGSGTLETHTIFGQPFNGTNDVRGDLSDVDTISANSDIITDGDLVIRGKDEDSVYTDQNLAISKDIGKTVTFLYNDFSVACHNYLAAREGSCLHTEVGD